MAGSIAHLIAGGAAIGAAAALLVLVTGQIAGISNIWGQLMRADAGRFRWRLAFLSGLLLPAALPGLAGPVTMAASLPALALAGFLVGLGTRCGAGRTSGHGVCGNANFSRRSLVATLTFMVTAALTVFVTHHVV